MSLLLTIFILQTVFADYKQVGKATFYSDKAHGHMTSNGEIYHKDSFTCAHRTLPFGTILKVRDLVTDKVVYVRVTDRGPFSHAIIDLSSAAAKRLNMIRKGIARVEITKVIDTDRVPYQGSGLQEIPQFSVEDPESQNGFSTLSEWAEKQRLGKRDSTNAEEICLSEEEYVSLVNDTIPEWKVFQRLCEERKPVPKNSKFKYILK